MSRQTDFVLYLVCDGCHRIATFRGADRTTAFSRAKSGGWAIRLATDHCRSCERVRQKEGS